MSAEPELAHDFPRKFFFWTSRIFVRNDNDSSVKVIVAIQLTRDAAASFFRIVE